MAVGGQKLLLDMRLLASPPKTRLQKGTDSSGSHQASHSSYFSDARLPGSSPKIACSSQWPHGAALLSNPATRECHVDKDSRQRHGGHLGSYFRTNPSCHFCLPKIRNPVTVLGRMVGPQHCWHYCPLLCQLERSRGESGHSFCRGNPVIKPALAQRYPSVIWGGSFFRTRLSKPGRRTKRKGCLGESGGTLESSGSGSRLGAQGQVTLVGTGVRQPPWEGCHLQFCPQGARLTCLLLLLAQVTES